MKYIHEGLMFPRNRDKDGKIILVLKSKQHVRGLRNTDQLIRNFVYWVERLNRWTLCDEFLLKQRTNKELNIHREEHFETISVFFDLAGTGLKNLDVDYTKQIVDLLKFYYPNNLNYIFVYELPWILNGKMIYTIYNLYVFDQMCVKLFDSFWNFSCF